MPQKWQHALTDPAEVERICNQYVEDCENDLNSRAITLKSGAVATYGKRPTVEGLAGALGVTTRTLERYTSEFIETERKHHEQLAAARSAALAAVSSDSAGSLSPASVGGSEGGTIGGECGGVVSPSTSNELHTLSLSPDTDSRTVLNSNDSIPDNITLLPCVIDSTGDTEIETPLQRHSLVCRTIALTIQKCNDVLLQHGLNGLSNDRIVSLYMGRWLGYGQKTEIDMTVRVVVESATDGVSFSDADVARLGR